MKYLSTILFLSLAFANLVSCSSTTETVRTTGAITGSVSLFEMDCTAAHSQAGIKAEILGTSYQAFTDTAGRWVLSNIPAGYYTFRFSKPGFTQEIYSGISFLGVDTMYWSAEGNPSPSIARINNFRLTPGNIGVEKNLFGSDTEFNLSIPFTEVDSMGHTMLSQFVLFIGRDTSVDYRNSSSYITTSRSEAVQLSSSAYNIHSGQTLYARAYATNCVPPWIDYYDHDRPIRTWVGFGEPSPLITIVLR